MRKKKSASHTRGRSCCPNENIVTSDDKPREYAFIAAITHRRNDIHILEHLYHLIVFLVYLNGFRPLV